MSIRLAATESELNAIYRFRYGIYIEEMGKPMPGADHERRELRDGVDGRATQLFSERDGEITGTVRIVWGIDGVPENYAEWYGLEKFRGFSNASTSFTGRMMVAQKFRNGPLSLVLAKEAYRLGCERGVAFDFIHTTPPLIPLFERLGHRRYNGNFVDPELGPRTPMVLVLSDRKHLENCRSPFLPILRTLSPRPNPVTWFKRTFAETAPARSLL
jgi:hypothetical protein